MKRPHLARDIIETIALTLLLFLVVHFAVQNYHVQGVSMQPGLQDDEVVVVNKLAYLFHGPERGDVIVFHWPKDTTKDFIKRIIGLPGDTVTVDSTDVWVNGVKLNEPYISAKFNQQGDTWKLGANQFFVMGDNRPDSDDSRDWGFVPRSFIVGKAVMIYWPFNRFQFINTYQSVYASVKANH